MKYFKLILILCLFQFYFSIKQWPRVDNVKKSRYLPSLEVKIHAPDQFQPKVQAELTRVEEKREMNERKWMQDLENSFNQELANAGKEITRIVKDALAVFDDPNLLNKSVEYAINPPLIIMTNNQIKTNVPNIGDSKSPNDALGLSFKEIAKFKMNKLQKETMNILVEDDNKIEKLRNPKVNIIMDEDNKKDNLKSDKGNDFKFKQKNSKINSNNQSKTPQTKLKNVHNGPIEISDFYKNEYNFSFAELGTKMLQKQAGYTKPISVLMKLPKEPDPKIKKEIGTMESKREKFESNLFKKAKEEFKLITALTKKELQLNLNHELLPFFIVSKNSLQGVNGIISSTVPSQTINSPGLLKIDTTELMNKFPELKVDDKLDLNKNVYGKLMNMFSSKPSLEPSSQLKSGGLTSKLSSLKSKIPKPNLLKKALSFSFKECLKLAKNLKNINCEKNQKDFDKLNDHLYYSFLESTQGNEELINVKFASSDDPYPTIEKLVAQMITRRDLAEKFERLKILEFQSRLQKAENEMIQDILHENLYRIVAFYGPAIEGMKEHIR